MNSMYLESWALYVTSDETNQRTLCEICLAMLHSICRAFGTDIAFYNDTNISSREAKKATLQSFARVAQRTYLIPYLIFYEYVLQEVAILPTFDFRIFLDAKLWKTIPKIRFSIYFSRPNKIDGNIAAVPPPKKKVKITPIP